MSDESAFLQAIRANPDDDTTRLVYADWLDERGDARGRFVRLHLALRSVAPDHVQRTAGECELSQLRRSCSREWLTVIETERAHLFDPPPVRPHCECFQGLRGSGVPQRATSCEFHIEPQDTECIAWKRLCEVIEEAALDGREELVLIQTVAANDLCRIITLPPTIAQLKKVKRFLVGGSCLLRIPPEIGEMTALERFDAYTSYRLHWYPYEITRCKKLSRSAVSTRALYGNNNYHPPFPRLAPGTFAGRIEPTELPVMGSAPSTIRRCSVCNEPFQDQRQHRAWISLRVAKDVLPLLVNACSEECIGRLPPPAGGYTKRPHRGGSSRQQQQTSY